MVQPIKAQFVILEPVDPSQVPAGALYLDQSTNQMSVKTSGGLDQSLEGGGGTNYFVKKMVAGVEFPINTPVAKRVDGKIVVADSDDAPGFVGYALQQSNSDGHIVNIFLVAANLPGVLTGLGFETGDTIFVSKTGGYTNDAADFEYGDNIIKVGIADCAAGTAETEAVDLIAYSEVISEA